MPKRTRSCSPIFWSMLVSITALALSQSIDKEEALQRCKEEEFRCAKYMEAKNMPLMRTYCEKCYTSCNIVPLLNDGDAKRSSEWCLSNCVGRNCSFGGGEQPFGNLFQCKYHGRACYFDYTRDKWEYPKSCPICVDSCAGVDTFDSEWCAHKCKERNCTAVANGAIPTASNFRSTTTELRDRTKSTPEQKEALKKCKNDEFRCHKYMVAKDMTQMRTHCERCYNSCTIDLLTSNDVAKRSSEWCLNNCVGKKCGAGDGGGEEPFGDLFQCKYHGRACYFDYRKETWDYPNSCPICTNSCANIDTFDSNWCKVKCKERNCTAVATVAISVSASNATISSTSSGIKSKNTTNTSLSSNTTTSNNSPVLEKAFKQCKNDKFRCNKYATANETAQMRTYCEKCYNSCTVEILVKNKTAESSSQWCLRKCVGKKCGAGGGDESFGKTFKCKYHRRVCYLDSKRDEWENPKSCPLCTDTCNGVDMVDSAWCKDRCEERNCTNIANAVSKPTPEPNNNTTATGGIKTSVTKKKIKLWDWLGPVLGALATIVGAIITVVWVRDFRRSKNSGWNNPAPLDEQTHIGVESAPYVDEYRTPEMY